MGHKEVGNSKILSADETKRNIQKRCFGYGASVETEVTEGFHDLLRLKQLIRLGTRI